MISLIVAIGENYVIGHENDMPWNLPNDLRYFKETTTGHTIVMGRKTFESIGGLLPNRKHIVLTRSNNDFPNEVMVVNHIEEILQYAKEHHEEELFIIGGGQLYKEMMPYADRLYITKINETFVGDVYFPKIDKTIWKVVSEKKGIKDDKNRYEHSFLIYER